MHALACCSFLVAVPSFRRHWVNAANASQLVNRLVSSGKVPVYRTSIDFPSRPATEAVNPGSRGVDRFLRGSPAFFLDNVTPAGLVCGHKPWLLGLNAILQPGHLAAYAYTCSCNAENC